ncbi:MAG: hypothetical protein IM638_15155 [Bacteroidetes bacterium]|nr:hypothetical protein [Bacteroidota bacterium]
MKKSLLFLQLMVFVMLIALPQLSCTRKGDDDPLLSLRTRKSRVCGKWKISEGRTRMDYSARFMSAVYSQYNGQTETVFTPYSNQVIHAIDYTLEIEFNRDNTFTWVMNWNSSAGVSEKGELKGQWDFLSKSDHQKNKVELILTPESNTGNWLYSYSCPFPASQQTPVFILRELRNDKMVIRREFNISTESLQGPFTGQTSPYFEEWILEPR